MYNITLYIINPQTSLRRFSRFHFHARLLCIAYYRMSIRSVRLPRYMQYNGVCMSVVWFILSSRRRCIYAHVLRKR